MMPAPATRPNRQACDGLRSCTTPHAELFSRYRRVIGLPFDSGHAGNPGIDVMGQQTMLPDDARVYFGSPSGRPERREPVRNCCRACGLRRNGASQYCFSQETDAAGSISSNRLTHLQPSSRRPSSPQVAILTPARER